VSAMRDYPGTGGPSVPEDILRRLEFPFSTDPVDAPLKARGL
jgi:hypothetical protein